MTAMAPTCDFRCPEKKGTCFPAPCRHYLPPSALEAARWRRDQCRKTVREGEEELAKRREALRQAEIAFSEVVATPQNMGKRNGAEGDCEATPNFSEPKGEEL